jgi:hypothetical protein
MTNSMVYFINMICVSDDYVEIQTHDRASIVKWLKSIDHEGSSWSVLAVDRGAEAARNTLDITAEIAAEYATC